MDLPFICRFWRRRANSSLQETRATGALSVKRTWPGRRSQKGQRQSNYSGEATIYQKQKALAANYANRAKSYVVENTLVIEYAPAKRGKKAEQKMKASPTMLLKTHVEKMSVWATPTMFMKTSDLGRHSHDIHENKGSCAPGSSAGSRR